MHTANKTLAAETLGLRALAFLAATPEDFQRFLTLSGLDEGTVRAHAAEPEFLTAVLDFLLSHESLLSTFCVDEELEPTQVRIARRELAGPFEE